VKQVGQVSIGGQSFFSFVVGQGFVVFVYNQVKDVYTLALQDRDSLNKHTDCKMKRRGSCSGGRDREKKCVTLVIATTSSKRGRPPKDPLVFVKTNPTSTLNTPLRHYTWLKKN
jgi:hypothetical protein